MSVETVKRALVGLVAGVVAGVLLGAVARLMMRLANVAAGRESDFTVAGTAGILFVFAVAAIPGAVFAALWRGRGRWVVALLMALLLCIPAAAIAHSDLGDFLILSNAEWLRVAAATAGVFVTILALPLLTLRLVPRRPAREDEHHREFVTT